MRRRIGLAVLSLVLFPTEGTAHRLDEYLQAARIALTPGSIRLELDLTPGANIAASVIARIDADHDGRFSGEEAAGYAGIVLRDVVVWLDGTAGDLRLHHAEVSTPEELLDGVGTIRIVATTPVDARRSRHQLTLRSDHEMARGVYLMNVLVPETDDIIISSQTRERRQREFRVEYEVRSAASQLWWILAAALSLATLGVCRLVTR